MGLKIVPLSCDMSCVVVALDVVEVVGQVS